jgi:hypothetical protein
MDPSVPKSSTLRISVTAELRTTRVHACFNEEDMSP